MTIREMEARSGMTRANIRFYEAEGLLQPARKENGYRDYSEEDLTALKRIKLLRALGLPLIEIKQLQLGGKSLCAALDAREAELTAQQQQNETCLHICAQMREDRAEYRTLNAQKYLDSMSGSSAVPVPADDQVPQLWAPWRRFFARVFDYFLYSCLWRILLVGLCSKVFFYTFPFALLATATMLLLEPLLLCFFKTTPGKWLMGITVTDDLGGRLSYSKGFKRTLSALFFGAGMGIPIFRLIRLLMSYYSYYKDKPLSWEYDSEEMIQENRTRRCVAMVIVCIALLLCFMAAQAEAQKPLHRGDLTVAQFAENYNHYQWYYHGEGRTTYLDTEGQMAYEDFYGPDTVSVEVTGEEKVAPKITYTENEGVLTGVCIENRFTSGEIVIFGSDQVALAFLSFVLAQPEWKQEEAQEVLQQMIENPFGEYHTTIHGVEITYQYESSGFEPSYEITERWTIRKEQ